MAASPPYCACPPPQGACVTGQHGGMYAAGLRVATRSKCDDVLLLLLLVVVVVVLALRDWALPESETRRKGACVPVRV